jgi:poly(A) polymerase
MGVCRHEPRVRQILKTLAGLVTESYLVGGAVRDHLLGSPDYADVDVAILGDGFEVARRLSDLIGPDAAFVPLDREFGTGRIVLVKEGHLTLDISSFKGKDILEDLQRRDFTINALAVKLSEFLSGDFHSAIDPTDGLGDLQKQVVRSCSTDSFKDDPLRILRAFRFSAALQFKISPSTLDLIPGSLATLVGIAPERITAELFGILSTPRAHEIFRGMDGSGIHEFLFPELMPMKGCTQNEFHHLDVWDHSLETLRQLELLLVQCPALFGEFSDKVLSYLSEEPVKGRSRAALLKLAAVFHDSGKPACRSVDPDGRIRFFGHEKVSKLIFEACAARLKLANREISVIAEWIGGHMRSMVILAEPVSRRALYRLHKKFDRDIIGLYLLFLADISATRGPAREPDAEEKAYAGVLADLTAYFDADQTPKVPLLRGRDLINLFALSPGPYLGAMLNHLEDLYGAGEITTREEAIAAVRRLLRENKSLGSDSGN